MNLAQRIVLIVGLLVILGMCIVPPVQVTVTEGPEVVVFCGHMPIWRLAVVFESEEHGWEAPPYPRAWINPSQVDLSRLLVQIFGVSAATGALFLVFKRCERTL